jgi:hypothetical protein
MDIDTSKTLFIMGNGPSLGTIMNNEEYLQVLRNNDTFGLNAAYRAYKKYNFYPTYFGCFDYIVNISHKEAFENLVLEDNPIKQFYFIGNGSNKQRMFKKEVYEHPKFKQFHFNHVAVAKYKHLSSSFNEYYSPGSSGANAVQIGIILGYKNIVLLGCDCNYVEKIDGVEHYDEKMKNRIVLTKNLDHNPNYWFSEYQQKGDKFNLPKTDRVQMGSWKNIHNYCPKDVTILNGSTVSKIPYFPKIDFTTLL